MEEYIKMRDNNEIYFIANRVANPKVNLIINHGFAEHSRRYDHVAKAFNERDISVFRYDLRGHGRTKTKSGDINSFFDFINDLDEIVDLVHEREGDIPLINLGHSMGGAISLIYGIDHPDKLNGQIFSGAGVIKSNEAKGIKSSLLKILSKIAPETMIKNPITNSLCSDIEVVQDYIKDPYNIKKANARFLNEFQNIGISYIEENISKYNYPCLITHGEKDDIISSEASNYIFNSIKSEDKELIIYDDLYHEILNEKNNMDIINDMISWIYKRF